jgi:molybdopterin/thiamine biosynthesis adenylyltransferase/proteasome lid subunit RPN8/RPN11
VTPTLALREEHWRELIGMLDLKVETAGFVLAGFVRDDEDEQDDDNELTLLGRSIGWVPEEHYIEREPDGLDIASPGYWPFLSAAARDEAVPIFVHTHPRMGAKPSRRDHRVDEVLRDPALLRSRAPFYVSLIVGGTSEKPTFTGRVYNERGLIAQLERLRVVGRRVHLLLAEGHPNAEIDAEVFDRQILAFGEDGQRMLARLRVGVVGAGGTGSAVIELLLRGGVRQPTVIDDDIVTKTNVTRIHESGAGDDGSRKVDVMEAAGARIGLGATVKPIFGRSTNRKVARRLRHLDVIFGCTDDEKGRLALSKLALTHLIPVFDMAVAVDPNFDGSIRAIDARVTTLLPGEACLLCRGRISPEGLAAEDLDPDERRRRAGEGYVPGLGDNDPSVGTFTTLIGGLAVNEFLDRLFGYSEGSATFRSSELLFRLADRRLGYTSRPAVGPHWCADESLYGRGDAAL